MPAASNTNHPPAPAMPNGCYNGCYKVPSCYQPFLFSGAALPLTQAPTLSAISSHYPEALLQVAQERCSKRKSGRTLQQPHKPGLLPIEKVSTACTSYHKSVRNSSLSPSFVQQPHYAKHTTETRGASRICHSGIVGAIRQHRSSLLRETDDKPGGNISGWGLLGRFAGPDQVDSSGSRKRPNRSNSIRAVAPQIRFGP